MTDYSNYEIDRSILQILGQVINALIVKASYENVVSKGIANVFDRFQISCRLLAAYAKQIGHSYLGGETTKRAAASEHIL